MPKASKGSAKKAKDSLESDPAYLAKRERNNLAVQKSRQKAKEKAQKTKQRVMKLKEDNKILEGKIEEQRKTKKFLKDLFLNQTMKKFEQPTKEQLELLEEPSSDEEEESDRSSTQSESSEDSASQEDISIASSRRTKR